MRSRGTGEEGMALLVVMVLMGVMLTAGIAIASTVDTQTSASQAERVRDSAFNLAESALNAQIFVLGRDWPGFGRSSQPYGACTPTSAGTRCPDNASLVAGGSPDLTGATWTTSVRDNGAASAPNFYSDASSASQPGYDANNDGRVWVRAQAVAQGRARTLVALARSEKQEENMPHVALLAGSLDITNNGNKELLRAGSGLVAVRCEPVDTSSPSYSETCLGHELSGSNKTLENLLANLASQVSGATPAVRYAGAAAMTPEARARLKATAIADGTYYAGCPTDQQLKDRPGQVAYVESGNCSYGSNAQFNSPQAPGMLFLNAGTISFGGTTTFYGVVYAANTTGLTTGVVQTQGDAQIIGGVVIDGGGQMVLGASGLNLQFDVNAFRAVASYGSAGVVQNTFREIRAG